MIVGSVAIGIKIPGFLVGEVVHWGVIDPIARIRKLSGVFLIERVTDPQGHQVLYVDGGAVRAGVLRPGEPVVAPAVFWNPARARRSSFVTEGSVSGARRRWRSTCAPLGRDEAGALRIGGADLRRLAAGIRSREVVDGAVGCVGMRLRSGLRLRLRLRSRWGLVYSSVRMLEGPSKDCHFLPFSRRVRRFSWVE